ncbi:hypothetical protein BRD22_06920 [Halobacteriales archaeon SW_8_68_21]|nr:MAG: hypothetical protein BRD22_06920 [Halobacteriales archaeon SW_8_68_21]
MGSLAAGGAAAMGTGAFTSVTADRGISVSVSGDNGALLGLGPAPGSSNHPNAEYLSEDGSGPGGEIAVDVENVNTDSETRIDSLFQITNNGTQDIWVWFTLTGNGFKTQVYFYPDDNRQESLTTYGSNGGALGSQGASQVAQKILVGESLTVGMFIMPKDGSDGTKFGNGDLRIHADTDSSNAPNPEGVGGS